MPVRALIRFAWATLAVNVGVIVFGAYVRATGSGAGCGPNWPTCHGSVIPAGLEGARAVEFTHRATSGVALLMVAWLVRWVFRSFPRRHPARRGAALSGLFILAEAAIGGLIVVYGWVAEDTSAARTAAVPIHLVNTLLLLAALTLTIWSVSGGGRVRLSLDRGMARLLVGGGIGVVLIAATGAITALADTLFPLSSPAAGLPGGLDEAEHFLTRLRVAHPIVAVVVGVYVARLAWNRRIDERSGRRRSSVVLLAFLAIQFAAGPLNIALLTPVWLQLVHLLLADLVWVSLIWFGLEMLEEPAGRPAPV